MIFFWEQKMIVLFLPIIFVIFFDLAVFLLLWIIR